MHFYFNEEKNNDHQQRTKSSNIINLQNQADYKNMVKVLSS